MVMPDETCDIIHDGIDGILECRICEAWLALLIEETENE